MQKGFAPILIILILVAVLLGGYLIYQQQIKPNLVACTQDAKICPDGSAVGRTGPKCEFTPCPPTTSNESSKILNDLTSSLNPNNTTGLKIDIAKVVGDFATGGVGIPPQGAAWIAKKEDGKWIKIWDGVNDISCSIVNNYRIPKEIYGECYQNY